MGNAIGMVEFNSISRGIYAVDQMVKTAEVEIVTATTTCPGKYFAIVTGDVASVNNSVEVGEQYAKEYLIDSLVIPSVAPEVFPAIAGGSMPEYMNAVGIVEAFALAPMVVAADSVLKAVDVEAIELRLGNGLGGKSFFTFTGDVAAVAAGIESAKNALKMKGLLVNAEVIPSPSPKVLATLF